MLTNRGAYESIVGGVDYGLLSMNWDPAYMSGTFTALTPAGTIFVMRIPVARPMLVTNLHIWLGAAGSGLTANQCLAALFQNGTLLSPTGNQATAWGSTGYKTMALTTPQLIRPGHCDLAMYYNGSTGPAPIKALSPSAAHNLGLVSPNMRMSTADTGRTTTFPSTLGAETSNNNLYWAGIS